MTLPKIMVSPEPFVKGLNSLADISAPGPGEIPPPLLELRDFEEALNCDWNVDAHALMYVVADASTNDVIASPRINKPAIPEILSSGCNVFVTFLGIDIDSPKHLPLTPTSLAELEETAAAAFLSEAGIDAHLNEFTAYYTTRAGMRFLYVLDDPIPATEAEPFLLGLIKAFKAAGFNINEKECKDWTRLFRLPRAVRDGTRLGHRPFDELIVRPECSQYPVRSYIKPVVSGSTGAAPTPLYVRPLKREMPDDTIFPDLCETLDKKGKPQPSKMMKEAKARLKNRMCYGCIFDGDALALPGTRDSTIQRYVGEACSLLSLMPGCTAEFIYAIFLPAVSIMPPDENPGHPGWRAILWKAVCTYWPREQAIQQHAAKIEEETWASVVAGMRTWDKSPELHSTQPHEVREYVKRRGLIAAKGQYFILKQDGTYETTPTDYAHIIARIRELGMDRVLSTYSLDGSKGIQDRSIQSMLNANVATGFEIEGVVTEDGDGTIKGKHLIKTLFRRKSAEILKPEFNADVDAWLRIFAGGQYENLCRWIGLALAWDEGPICSLSIKGPPGCGKKLLVQGLTECVDTEKTSDAIEFSKFKSGILESPWLVVNEGFPSHQSMTMPPADTFRAFVGGDPIRVEEKFRVPITIRNPLRIIFTTNNDDVIRTLAGGRDLTPYDRDAIAQRLFHVDVQDAATKWLLSVGGLSYTRGWIAGDSGARSRYVVARHFLYLYENRPQHGRGSRLLMEGTNNERLIKAMTLRSGAAPAIFEVITRLIELAGKRDVTLPCAIVEPDGSIYITEHMIERYEQQEFSGRQTNHHVVKNVLAAMREPGTQPERGVKGTGQNRTLAVWHKLNANLIFDEAIQRGLPCMNLEKIISGAASGSTAGPTQPQPQGVKT